MATVNEIRTLVYKRTNEGDPDPDTGLFGNNDCMGRVRGWHFDAVIGVGGVGSKAVSSGLAGKLTWVGIGPHCKRASGCRGPQVSFDHFLYYGQEGPTLEECAPHLATHIYGGRVRATMTCSSSKESAEVDRILMRALKAPPSRRSSGVLKPKAHLLRPTCQPRPCRTKKAKGKAACSGQRHKKCGQ